MPHSPERDQVFRINLIVSEHNEDVWGIEIINDCVEGRTRFSWVFRGDYKSLVPDCVVSGQHKCLIDAFQPTRVRGGEGIVNRVA